MLNVICNLSQILIDLLYTNVKCISPTSGADYSQIQQQLFQNLPVQQTARKIILPQFTEKSRWQTDKPTN